MTKLYKIINEADALLGCIMMTNVNDWTNSIIMSFGIIWA